jgi:hypothetical protein
MDASTCAPKRRADATFAAGTAMPHVTVSLDLPELVAAPAPERPDERGRVALRVVHSGGRQAAAFAQKPPAGEPPQNETAGNTSPATLRQGSGRNR